MKLSSHKSGVGIRRTRLLIGLLFAAVSGHAVATGWAPFAQEDSATVARGGSVSVLNGGANSVLANDFDFEGDPMTAILTRKPKEGSVVLNENGTFLYTHSGNNKDHDEFKYRAFDGTGYSRETRVRIEISGPPNQPPQVIGTPPAQEAIANRYYELALAGYFIDPDPDDRLSYSASGLPGGGRISINPSTGILSGTPAASDARNKAYDVRITARDSGGGSANLDFKLTIFEDNRADMAVGAAISGNPVTVGETARWDIDVRNLGPGDLDEGTLEARWLTSGNSLSLTAPQGCSLSGNNTRNPSMTCTLGGLLANQNSIISVNGTQAQGGDNSIVAVVNADDPVLSNNSVLKGSAVVERFSEGPVQMLSVGASDVSSADFNGDGHMDIVVAVAGQSIVYFNNGNRGLTVPGSSLGNGSGGTAVTALDWNSDGAMDIAVGGTSGGAARVYINDGSGGVAGSHSLNVSGLGEVRALRSADFDRDGDDDLVIVGTGDAKIVRGSGGSRISSDSLPGGGGIDVAVADLDQDGFDDVIFVQSGNRALRVLRNSGNGQDFGSQTLQRGSAAGISASDVNGDGRVDLLVAVDGADYEPPESRILLQSSDGNFPAGTAIGASPLARLLAGDINGDQLADIVAVNLAGIHQVYLGKAGGGFQLDAEQLVSSGMQNGMLVDFNGDTSLDLVMLGRSANVMEIHANNGIGRLGLGDQVAPVISMIGEATLSVPAGQDYVDPGVSAIDDIDGDLSAFVIIDSNVDAAIVGSYSVSYAVADRAGNIGTATRIVNVGINEGVGGSGGGTFSPAFLLLQLLLFVSFSRHRNRRIRT